MHNAFHVTPVKGLPKPMSGGKWEIVDEFQGRSHGDGGMDILVHGGRVHHVYAPNEKPDEIAKNGRVWRSIGAGAYGVGEGLLDTLTFGATDQLTDLGYSGLQKIGGAKGDELREQDSIRGYGTAAGAITGGILSGGATTGSAIQQGAKGVGAGVGQGSPDSKLAQAVGTYLPLAGSIAGLAVGNAGYGSDISAATKGADAATAIGDTAKAAELTNKAAQLTKLSKIATTAGKVSKFAPLIQGGLTALQSTGQKQPLNLGPTQEVIRGLTPYTSPAMMESYKQLGKEIKNAGGPSNQTSYTNLDGEMPTYGAEGGPIQFRQQPISAAEAYSYLNRYGINV
jgi:hypothetical protein